MKTYRSEAQAADRLGDIQQARLDQMHEQLGSEIMSDADEFDLLLQMEALGDGFARNRLLEKLQAEPPAPSPQHADWHPNMTRG
jgi:hypothetical protein